MKIYVAYNDQILIPQEDGSYRVVINSEWIPAFYALPAEIIVDAEKNLQSLPCCPADLLLDLDCLALVESDKFLETIIDGYAYLIWNAMGMKGWMEYYSGYAPQWIMARETPLWLSRMQQERILWTNNDLFAEPLLYQQIGFPSLAEAYDMVSAVAEYVLSLENRKDVIKVCNNIPCEEDFDQERYFNRRLLNFRREWYHRRTKHPMVSLNAILEKEHSRIHQRLMRMETEDDMEEDAISRIDGEAFFRSLSDTDQKILFLRNKGKPMQEVASLVGLKTHSAVYKRIQKIGKAYEQWADEDLGFS
ncbi:MAG: hypothetical protein IJ138_03315 [Clostridia bacterium]|nr:hypothetical protein [Clostridia bacterium]